MCCVCLQIVFVCVCVSERERERERKRRKKHMCNCVCVCERERERKGEMLLMGVFPFHSHFLMYVMFSGKKAHSIFVFSGTLCGRSILTRRSAL